MKGFIAGLVFGVAACLVLFRLFDRSPVVGQVSRSPLTVAPKPANATEGIVAPSPTIAPQRAAAPGQIPARSTPLTDAAVDEPDVGSAAIEQSTLEGLSNDQLNQLTRRANAIVETRERAIQDAEPKDQGWALPLEQLIRQHMETFMRPDQFTKLEVECRTSFCRMRIEGGRPGDQADAYAAAQEIEGQQWNDLTNSLVEGGFTEGSQWHVAYEWQRARDEAELRILRRARERQGSQ